MGTPQEPSSRFERCVYVWVVMSDSSKTTSHQQQSVKLPIECSPMPQAISAMPKLAFLSQRERIGRGQTGFVQMATKQENY